MIASADINIVSRDDGLVEASWRDVWLLNHQSGSASARMKRLLENVHGFAQQRDRMRLVLIAAGQPPDKPSRDEFVAFLRRYQDRIDDIAVWIPISGLWGSTVRSVATAIFMLSGVRTRSEFVANEGALLRFLSRSGTSEEARRFLAEATPLSLD